jgi:glycosyltransferase involved in cell wall biosynthesis
MHPSDQAAMLKKCSQPAIHVYLITYRRPSLLKRALASVLAQSYQNFRVKIINDDPADDNVLETIARANDQRVSLFIPVRKRGATANFNIAFGDKTAPFVSELEDDNWWEPTFLKTMRQTLLEYPRARAAICNELVWKELDDGSWLNTGRKIWDHEGVRLNDYSLEQIAGSATMCNSSTLLKTDASLQLDTPGSIPIDVTEHFRERLLDAPVVLLGRPLVNYAETIKTARSTAGSSWGTFQCLLIGSIFVALGNARDGMAFAKGLWDLCSSSTSPRAMSLVMTGLYIREARPLLTLSPARARMRFMLWIARHPLQLLVMSQMRRKYEKELEFLVRAPLTRRLVGKARKVCA